MVEGQGPVTPGNRRKRIGANSPAVLRKMSKIGKALRLFFYALGKKRDNGSCSKTKNLIIQTNTMEDFYEQKIIYI